MVCSRFAEWPFAALAQQSGNQPRGRISLPSLSRDFRGLISKWLHGICASEAHFSRMAFWKVHASVMMARTCRHECDDARREAVSMRAGMYQWCVPPVATGEHTAVRIDQYDESIRLLNAQRVVDAAGSVQTGLVGWVLVHFLSPFSFGRCPSRPARQSRATRRNQSHEISTQRRPGASVVGRHGSVHRNPSPAQGPSQSRLPQPPRRASG
jgi:hypothetical protein